MSKPAFVSQVSKDTGGLPTWLNQHELQSFILESNPKVQDITKIVTRSEIFSQNILSVQIQVKLTDNSTQVLNYLVKSNEQTTSISSTPKFPRRYNFKLELHMYNEVLPALKNLYKNVGKQITFSPDNYSSKGSNHLYLANLQAKGYRTIIQPKGLRKSAMMTILSKLAAYHAATACYLQLTPTHLKAQLKRNLGNDTDAQIIQRKTWLQRKFSESLRSNGSIDTPDLQRSFNVISIGACWPNNILGSFDAFGEVKDVVFIDFGNSSYRSAAHDLFEILLTVPVEKTENFDAFLRYYHDELLINLKLLKFKGNLPTLTDLQLDLLNYGYEGFYVVMEILPIVLADFESTDIEDPFRTKNYSEEIKNLLPWMENRAYFEVETEPIMLY